TAGPDPRLVRDHAPAAARLPAAHLGRVHRAEARDPRAALLGDAEAARARARGGGRVKIVFRWRGWTQLVLPLALVGLVFAVWEAVIKLFTIAPYVLPSPGSVFSAMSDDW